LILQHLCHLSTPLKVKEGAFGTVPYYRQIGFSVNHYLKDWDKSLQKKVFFYVGLILLSCNFQTLSAQGFDRQTPSRQKQTFRTSAPSPDQETTSDLSSFTSPNVAIQSLEKAIDPETYLVGPGDTFQIGIWTGTESSLTIPVNPEGKLTIPTIGTIAVNKKSLADVRALIKKKAAKKYIGSPITVNLVALRYFRVHVTGQVMKPGAYDALAVDRASDLIARAGGLTDWGAQSEIEIRHLDGTSDKTDLYRYSKFGDLKANLHLQNGDVIYVPFINFQHATVTIEGVLDRPGIYQLAEKETIEQFLVRINAMNRKADLENAILKRTSNESGEYETIPIFPYLSETGNGHSELLLQDGDIILLPQRDEKVYVVGAVLKPGAYLFYPNFRVADYVGLAGSTEKATKLTKFKLLRQGAKEPVKYKGQLIKPGDTILVPEKNTFGVREIALITGQITTILLALNAIGVIKSR